MRSFARAFAVIVLLTSSSAIHLERVREIPQRSDPPACRRNQRNRTGRRIHENYRGGELPRIVGP